MASIFFEIDFIALSLAIIFCMGIIALKQWLKSYPSPYIGFSNLEIVRAQQNSWRIRLVNMPQWLMWIALALLILAFIDPHFEIEKQASDANKVPTEGIAIYLVADQSGSMAESVPVVTSKGRTENIPKIELLKNITIQFVEGDKQLGLPGRPNDLIGLVTFARAAHVLSPLTLDHSAIVNELAHLQVVQDRDQDGTAIGYAIFKTVNIIAATRHYAEDLIGATRPAYDIKSAIIILISDGFHAPSPLDEGKRLRNIDPIEAAQYAKDKDVKLYIINIEPTLSSAEFGPQRRLMQRATQLTGGDFYLIDKAENLAQIYGTIDKLAKSALPTPENNVSKDKQPNRYQRISLYPILIGLGMLLLMLAVVLQTVVLRRIP